MDKNELTVYLMHKDVMVARMSMTDKGRPHHIVINEPARAHLPWM